MSTAQPGWTDEGVDRIVGNLLRAGVLTAATVVTFGAILFLWQEGGSKPDYKQFHGEPASLRNVTDIVPGALSFHGRAVIQFGIVLLLATPVARVALTVVAFALQRDRLYVVVTLIVLAVLLTSIAGVGL
jgi:uncharacterized membrane protein